MMTSGWDSEGTIESEHGDMAEKENAHGVGGPFAGCGEGNHVVMVLAISTKEEVDVS